MLQTSSSLNVHRLQLLGIQTRMAAAWICIAIIIIQKDIISQKSTKSSWKWQLCWVQTICRYLLRLKYTWLRSGKSFIAQWTRQSKSTYKSGPMQVRHLRRYDFMECRDIWHEMMIHSRQHKKDESMIPCYISILESLSAASRSKASHASMLGKLSIGVT